MRVLALRYNKAKQMSEDIGVEFCSHSFFGKDWKGRYDEIESAGW